MLASSVDSGISFSSRNSWTLVLSVPGGQPRNRQIESDQILPFLLRSLVPDIYLYYPCLSGDCLCGSWGPYRLFFWPRLRANHYDPLLDDFCGPVFPSVAVGDPAQETEPKSKRTLISNVNIFDGVNDTLHQGMQALIKDNLIEIVSADPVAIIQSDNVAMIDGGGRTLMPGLIDSHVHTTRKVRFFHPIWPRLAKSCHAIQERQYFRRPEQPPGCG